ncbi:type VII secretion-associated serine protease mycosin [Streptomyces bohaiensis]|uniref:Type VII secretion-associated serine protease mycosin n=1 Tax=Streptomyces bohaiensis TaxID=1431344 RepID=A0ABX1CFI4_9ACTN|nr:type VII secretion-associated serine protease mycosin [Streptomyces bohaiensis]NJQ17813.1 type VII secretion-associated serine protease mycosin [Streptomyces bohaiensis]
MTLGSRSARRSPAAVALTVLGVLALLLTTGPTARADTIRDQQRWALEAVNAEEAWETTRGAGVVVAVLDTGVDASHRDLAGAVLEGADLVPHGAGPGAPTWAAHGTAMAGIIAGRGHGAARADGVIGIAPEAQILPVRVLLEEDDPARGQKRAEGGNAVAEGIRWAVDHGADVVNLSLGDDSESAHPDPEEDAAIRYALRNGVVVVASAGNGGESGDPVSYPAGYPGVIAVTAVDRAGSRAPFSTRRWYATVSAPGKDVIIAAPGDRYMQGWGTSAAAAFVSGAVALLRAAHPELTPAEVRRLLAATAREAPEGGHSAALGAGLVDPAAAIEAAGTDRPLTASLAGSHTAEYFGPGPRSGPPEESEPAWLTPAAVTAGVMFLLAAALLFFRVGPADPRRVRSPGVMPGRWSG